MEVSPRPSLTGPFSTAGDTARSADSSGGSQASSTARASSRTVLSDRYHLGEELGRGAFGLVFKGVDTRTGGAVAIKQLSLAGISAETLQSIMGEIELLKNLNHKNIVKYIGSFKTRTHLYIILEFMDRGAISSVIKPSQYGAFPESLVAVYIAQVLQGLAYLHDQGVVHRDIKGANILTTSEGLVKLADFGVAARLSELEADRDKSRISVVGTPYWMAPEVIEMTSTTPASDIWSVACLSIELLTGQPPYFDLQPMSALFRIVQDEKPELPTKMSGDMHDFLHQCFQKDPQKRPSARDLLRHKWITYNRRTLRSSWNRTQGAKNMGRPTDAHKSVSTVVEQILQAEADEFAASAAAAAAGKPLPPQPDMSNRTPQQIPMNQSRGSTLTDSRNGSIAGSRGSTLEKPGLDASEIAASLPLQAAVEPINYPLQQANQAQAAVAPERLSNGGDVRATPPAESHFNRLQNGSKANSMDAFDQQGLLEGLLQDPPARREAGEDLVLWLELREQNQLGSGEDALPSSEDMAEIVDGAVNSHQQAAEVRRLVAIWRQGYGRKAGLVGQPQATDRAAKSMEAGQALLAMCRDNPGRVETLLAEDGGVVLVELLQEPCNERVAIHVLQFLNELVTLSVKALGSSALLGVVLAAAKYAVDGGPLGTGPSPDARLQAAYFLQYLAETNLLTAQLLLTCQGLPVVLGLIEPDFEEFGPLVHIGVHSIWRILELHGSVSMNQICRLLSGAGLAQRLVFALGSAIAFSRDQKRVGRKQGRVGAKALPQGSPEQQKEAELSGGSLRAVASRAPTQSHPASYSSLDPSEGLQVLLEKMANLLLVLSHADTAVKGRLCELETLRTLFTAIENSSEALQLTVLKAIKQLTSDPSMLEALESAGTIGSLGKYLKAVMPLTIQVEALHALHNLCKISRQRQEAAASAGLVPYLMNLAQMSPKQVAAEPLQEQLRQMAISLLCGMVHSTWSTRMALWNCNGLHTLLELLKEEDWQGPALEALAAWLYEDMNRIEGRLSQQQSISRFVQLFNTYSSRGGSNALARLLEPFLKILRRSPQITIEVAIAGLAGIVVEMLKTASALTALSLLQMVRVIYEHHPRPKEFVAKYNITDQLRELSKARGSQSSVLVNKQATHLLHAFQINSIF